MDYFVLLGFVIASYFSGLAIGYLGGIRKIRIIDEERRQKLKDALLDLIIEVRTGATREATRPHIDKIIGICEEK